MQDFGSTDDDDIIAAVNIIPFVDIVLVLLIIFMLTSTVIVRAAMEVELPKAASAGESVESTLNIVFTKEGEILLNGDPIEREQLAGAVRTQAAANPELQAVVAADQGAEYGAVVELIDVIKLNGVKTFALNIERTPKPAQP